MIRKLTLAASAVALVSAPATAQAERASAPAADTQEMASGSGLVVAILAIAAIIAGIVIAVDGGNDDPLSA